MTDNPDRVDVVVGTPLGTSDHCNVWSTVFQKHRTNWDSVRSAVVRSCTWSAILKSADPLIAFDRAIGEVIGRYIPTTLCSRSGDKQWLDGSCRRAYDAKQTAYRAWCRSCNADRWFQFVLAHAGAQRVYGAARESHNELNRNTLKHSTCSHKWWEILKGVKPSIPALRGLEVVWWWILLRKPHSWAVSLTVSSVVSILSVLCLVSLSLGAILWPSELLSSCVCFSILIRIGVLILWVCFLYL